MSTYHKIVNTREIPTFSWPKDLNLPSVSVTERSQNCSVHWTPWWFASQKLPPHYLIAKIRISTLVGQMLVWQGISTPYIFSKAGASKG